MTKCLQFRPILSRLAEGETAPAESLQAARHLSCCTACRILLAREQHLAGMLDALGDAFPVEESFLQTVMDALPTGPPPGRRTAAWLKRRRGLKLAGAAGVAGLLAMLSSKIVQVLAAGRLAPILPRLELGGIERMLDGLGDAARLVLAVLDRIGTTIPLDLPALGLYARIGLALLLPVAAGLVMLSMLLALAARSVSRSG